MAGPQKLYYETLGSLVGRVRAIRPACPSTVAQDFANDRIRSILDYQSFWSGLWAEGIMYVPEPYDTGSIAFTQNSKEVTGTSTAWPVDDLVNTTISAGVIRTGFQVCTPASMDNITADTPLYVDASGTPEVVYPIEIRPTSFTVNFSQFHNPGCTMTASSMAGWQLRLGNTFPIFTVEAITSATTLLTDMTWQASADSGLSYYIWKMYYTLFPDIKALQSCIDQAQGIPPLRIDVPIQEMNRIDPQRSATGYPQILANRGPNLNGNIQWELWPRCQTQRQLRVFYFKQPPKLVSEGDMLPSFMSPSVLFNGVMSDVYRTKFSADDFQHNQNIAQEYEKKFWDGVEAASLQDDEHMRSRYSNLGQYQGYGGANFQKDHAVDLISYYGW